ncbi:MAG: aquaporin [Planctomycetota bacterium]|jgi:MIP family channel proteins|nr:aquaporin [Planctomycetota bacterium]
MKFRDELSYNSHEMTPSMNNDIRKSLAELIGTFALLFLGAGSICLLPALGEGPTPLSMIAAVHGMTLAVMVSTTLHLSGAQLNPAISISLWAGGKQPFNQTVLFTVAQLIGATLASFLLYVIFSQIGTQGFIASVQDKSFGMGVQSLNSQLGVTPTLGLLLEIFLTFFLVIVYWGTVVDRRGPGQMASLALGGVMATNILMAEPLTGASMNPARTFAPALISGKWSAHWVFWVGPIIGAVVAAILYKSFFLSQEADEA